MKKMTRHNTPRPERRDIDEQIDKSLKRAFDQVASEPVPDRFMELLQQLRDTDAEAGPTQGGAKHD